jgi:hypothetical protein
LADRIAVDQPVDVTPWNLNGVTQKGLGPDGEPLNA